MNTLKRGLIILVSVVFLAAVSIGETQAGTINTSKSNTFRQKSSGDNAAEATTVKSQTSNSSDREGTTVKGPKTNKGTGAERGTTIKTPWPKDKKTQEVYTPPKIKKDDKSSERGSGDPLKGLNVTKSKPVKP
jgi:hypothetical protein